MTNIVVANLAKAKFFRCPPLYQYNYGMVLRITGIDLPTAYEVDFSNDIGGTSITQIGSADGVTIPSQFFTPGQAIYCWLRVHPTQDSGITTATIVIPISPRATITDDEPTPEEQSAIDEAIAALNDAVDRAEDAVEHYPQITNGIWYVWDVDSGEYVSTGIPAQGAQGNPGVDGQDGTDGFSPTATVTQTASGATISITDKTGTTTANISNGQDGAPGQPGTDGTDGVSPTVTVTDITGGHRVTITDAEHPTGQTFDVMDGDTPTVPVQDVQVNGTSILSNGVANVPIANSTTPGAVRFASNSNYGIWHKNSPEEDVLRIAAADANAIKTGSSSYLPIVPANQHTSAFYAIAKAAGVDMASSSNPVGTYTDAAKSAIQKMLGIYEAPWELIREDTFTNTEEADHSITVDKNGEPFELTDVYLEFISPKQETLFSMGAYGRVDVYYSQSGFASFFFGAYTQQPNANAKVSYGMIEQRNGMNMRTFTLQTETGGLNSPIRTRSNESISYGLLDFGKRTYSKLILKSITGKAKYRLYGRRKWN